MGGFLLPDKLISVIIPCYNHEKYIQKTIRSVLEQTYPNLEILVADDCSLDDSVAAIREIKDSRIKTFFFEENHGTVYTLNYLLRKASGDYFATLGSDDYFRPDKLEKQIKVMEENPSLGAVFSWAEIIDENDVPYSGEGNIMQDIFQEPNRSQGEWLRYFFETGNHMCHSSALVRRSAQEAIGLYHSAYRQLHDFDCWLRILCRYPIYVIPEKLTCYRRQRECNSVSANSGENTVRLFNEYSSIFLRLFQNVDSDLFFSAFSDLLSTQELTDARSVAVEKYRVLRQLKMAGCHIRNASQAYFIDNLDSAEFKSLPASCELLDLYYADSARSVIDYPVTDEVLACVMPDCWALPANKKSVKLLRPIFSFIQKIESFKK